MATRSELELLRDELAKRDELLTEQAKVTAEQATVIAEQATINATLMRRVEVLEALVLQQAELLRRNSKNSNLPPSSDPPGKGGPKKRQKGRKRGGQKGHKGSFRRLVAVAEVDEIVPMFPARCEQCTHWLPKSPNGRPKRHQHTELLPLGVHVTEYQRHEVRCPACGHRTRALYDDEIIPRSAFGPRLMSVVVMLTGVYHLSRRQAARLLEDLFGLRISIGSVSNIELRMSERLEPAVDEVWTAAIAAKVKHADGTTWLQSGVMLALWTVATTAVTAFKIIANGQRDTLTVEVLPATRGVLVSDRATALKFWAMHRRQICWAHLLRKFISFAERDGPMRTLGRELLDCTAIVFAYWVDFKEGRLTRAQLAARIAPLRADFERTLRRAVTKEVKGLSGSCADIWEHREALWTFVDVVGVEPTNNHAERELRAFVLWRRRSFGTQSDRGNRFAERVMTIAHTARKQGRDILAFLVSCASRAGDEPVPSLLAPT